MKTGFAPVTGRSLTTDPSVGVCPIILEEKSGIGRTQEPVKVGVPFPKGMVMDTTQVVLLDQEGNPILVQVQVLSRWIEGSVQWALLDFVATVGPYQTVEYSVECWKADPVNPSLNSSMIRQEGDVLKVDTGKVCFDLNPTWFKPFEQVVIDDSPCLASGKSNFVLTDDSGKTWQTGYPVQSGTGEGTLAELSDGRIYYNSRCHMAVDHRRLIAWSHDGGNMWVDWESSTSLFEVGQPYYYKYGSKPSYGCNAGLVRIPDEVTGGKDVLLFSTLDNPGGNRVKMTVWASFDHGKTWPVKRLVYKGPSAYSSLAADKNGTIFLLFENGEKDLYERISLARFNLEWLTQRQDWRELLKNQQANK